MFLQSIELCHLSYNNLIQILENSAVELNNILIAKMLELLFPVLSEGFFKSQDTKTLLH